jgi:hypothetical protein
MEKIMTQPEIVRTTLGDLIAAVTDEVTAVMGDSPGTYLVVSYVVSDILSRRRKGNARRDTRYGSSPIPGQFGRRKAGDRI